MTQCISKTTLAALFGLCMGVVLLLGGPSHDQIAHAGLEGEPKMEDAQAGSVLRLEALMTSAEFAKCGLAKLSKEEMANLDQWVEQFTVAAIRAVIPASPVSKTPLSPSAIPEDATGARNPQAYDGASIIAQDGTFLGILSKNRFDTKSVANKFGDYGSKYSSNSIFNKFGTYGSEYSQWSPFNRFTSKPPMIVVKGKAMAYLTVNTTISPRVDPLLLLGWLEIER